jgi:hypothetical protein
MKRKLLNQYAKLQRPTTWLMYTEKKIESNDILFGRLGNIDYDSDKACDIHISYKRN